MSKAFLRESDFEVPDPPLARPAPISQAGGRVSFTPDGAARLREELARLTDVERPKIASVTPLGIDERTELQAIDQRIRQLAGTLRVAEIVPPSAEKDVVRFGASVTVRDNKKVDTRYRIVGVVEAGLEPDWISGDSPLGRALLNRRLGERFVFTAPRGEMPLEIVGVDYAG